MDKLYSLYSATDMFTANSRTNAVISKEPRWIGYTMHLQVWKHRDGFGGIQIWCLPAYKLKSIIFHLVQEIGAKLLFARYLACNVKWLGLRGDDLQLIPQQSLVPLKQRDLQIARSLMSSQILQVRVHY